jgi:SAM-dependent methyltransferase
MNDRKTCFLFYGTVLSDYFLCVHRMEKNQNSEVVNNNIVSRCQECEEYLGPGLFSVKFYQLSYQKFHFECLQKNSSESDSTGKRLYAGGHVGIRFLQYFQYLLADASILELGCGTGIIGLSTFLHSNPSRLLLTDGSEETLQITQKNIVKVLPVDKQYQVATQRLYWGNNDHIAEARQAINSEFFNVIIGCELMYYSTDIPNLISTICTLIDLKQGVFFHVHLFRKYGQEKEMVESFGKYNWITYQVPLTDFLTELEWQEHPEWNAIQAFISCSAERLAEIKRLYPELKGKIFDGEPTSQESGHNISVERGEGEEEETIFSSQLFSFF